MSAAPAAGLRIGRAAALLLALALPGAPAAASLRSLIGGGRPFLRMSFASERVASIRHCADGYVVTTADGKAHRFWEFNLRFKTDSSLHGPAAGAPVLVEAGMQGDRAYVVFSAPQEISGFVRESCAR
jgi:hypothetical protein